MKYKVITTKNDIILLKELKTYMDTFSIGAVRNKCLVKKNDRTFRLVLDCKNYSYRLLDIEDFSLLAGMSFSMGLDATIETLLEDGYEVIYEE